MMLAFVWMEGLVYLFVCVLWLDMGIEGWLLCGWQMRWGVVMSEGKRIRSLLLRPPSFKRCCMPSADCLNDAFKYPPQDFVLFS